MGRLLSTLYVIKMNTTFLIKVTRFIGGVLLAVLYVKLTTVFLTQYTKLMGNLLSDTDKILSVLVAVTLSCVIIFAVNKFIIKAPPILLGALATMCAFIFFYIIKPQGNFAETVSLINGVFMYLHSAVAFILLLSTPIITGILMKITYNKALQPTAKRGG